MLPKGRKFISGRKVYWPKQIHPEIQSFTTCLYGIAPVICPPFLNAQQAVSSQLGLDFMLETCAIHLIPPECILVAVMAFFQ